MATSVEEKAVRPSAKTAATVVRRDLFTRCAAWAARATGGRWGFFTAVAVVATWLMSGPFFQYSETWQLVINTTTSIVTFLMVFLIQNAQNRESKAIHLKLDELILCARAARNEMIDIEHLTDEQLDFLGAQYSKIAQAHFHKLEVILERERLEARERCADQDVPANGQPHA